MIILSCPIQASNNPEQDLIIGRLKLNMKNLSEEQRVNKECENVLPITLPMEDFQYGGFVKTKLNY